MWKDLFTDSRVIASTVTCLFLYCDDLPGWPYGTFRDPSGAVLLTIIFAQMTSVMIVRRCDRTSVFFWMFALIAKCGFQPLFYLQSALPIDALTMVGAHLFLGALVRRALHLTLSEVSVAALLGCIAALGVSWAVYQGADALGSHAFFWSFASARATCPYFFWTSLFTARYLRSARTPPNDNASIAKGGEQSE